MPHVERSVEPSAARVRPRRRVLLIALAVVVLVAGLVAADGVRRYIVGEEELALDPPFYSLPTPSPTGEPGSVVRSEPIESAPAGSRAWRIMYLSEDLAGDSIPVSAVLIVPDEPVPAGGRTIVSWAHPTTGTAARCAPSLGVDPFEYIAGLHELLLAGYAIVATDYPGLGVPGASSYLLGVPESNAVLDAVRAAQAIEGADVGSRVLLWGHSQGGQAALFAAERASTYASELQVIGVAVAAPAADLPALMTDDIVDVSGVTIASFAIPAYEAAYADRYPDGSIAGILTPAGAAATAQMNEFCLLTETDRIHEIAGPLVGGYVRSNPATTEPWQTLLRENSAGAAPITVPVFVAQGEANELVVPSVTEQYVKRLCADGTDVVFHRMPGVDHGLAGYAALPEMLPWLGEVQAGRGPLGNCG